MADHQTNDGSRAKSRLIADLGTRLGAQDLLEWIESQAEQLGALDPAADRGPITLLPQILRARNVRRIIDDSSVQRARIVPGEGGFEIRLNPALPLLAQRFAIAHELGHTFWFASRYDTTPLSPYQWVGARDPQIEMLCDRFAAALLLPRRHLLRWLRAYGIEPTDETPHFELLTPAARAFAVAEQAVARRLYVDLRPSPLAIVWARRVSRPALFDSESAVTHWETSWCAVPEFVRSAALEREQIIALKARRRIPGRMLPEATGTGTVEAHLDRRWLTGVTPQPKPSVRKKLDSWDSSPSYEGYAWRGSDRAVIGVPLAV
jgi:IrrE N-terminal-like domain